ncbi:MAG: hypothetical protein Q8P81_04525 [Nanoarchaeota archaeon]|nr:hypothetical protein [Nanoarchaeota archaeon]
MERETLVVIIVVGIWIISAVMTFFLTILSKKYEIKDKHVGYCWDLMKIASGALFGSLLGGGNI